MSIFHRTIAMIMDNGAYYYCLVAILPLICFLLVNKSWRASSGSRSHGRLRLPPGPWQWQLPIIGSLHYLRGSPAHRTLRDLALRHGPLMFLKLGEAPVVVASSGDAAKEFLKTHDADFSLRPINLTAKLFTEKGTGILMAPAYSEHWRQLRKICIVKLLSAKRVRSFRPVREEAVLRLVQAVSTATTPLVDVSKLVAVYVADVSAHAFLGRRLRFKEMDTWLQCLHEAVRLGGAVKAVDLFPSSRLVRALTLRRAVREAEEFRDSIFTFVDGLVREHLERKKSCEEEEAAEQEEIVDVLLRIQQEGNLKFPLTMSIIQAVVFDLMAGGSDGPASVLQWAMAELMRNPAIMSKAQAEARGVFMGQKKVTEERLSELSYLQLIIKETLRLHVPAPLLVPRECQEQCRMLGYDVPKGTKVLVNAWAIFRNPDYWEEPDMFNPERFRGDTRDFRGNDFDFIPFSAGRRICPGMAFGLANIELALANLLFYFDWSLPAGVVASELDMRETTLFTARRKADLLLSATPRFPLPS